MLTSDECHLLADAMLVHADELGHDDGTRLWFALDPEAVPIAHGLVAKGYLQRRYDREADDVVWRVTDQATRAQELGAAMAMRSLDVN